MKPESPFYAHCAAALRNSALFAGLDAAALTTLLSIGQHETWPKGARLPARQSARLFTIITAGRLELTRVSAETGRQMTLFVLGPGDAYDVITLLDDKPHEIDAIVLEALDIVTVPLTRMRTWIEAHPAFNRAFFPYLAEKIRALEDLSADLALCETVTRLARLILQQAVPLVGEIQRPLLVNTLSDETMAHMIGSVRVVVNRHIQDFIKLGLITTSRGQLIVQDLEKLREHCDQSLGK